MANDKHIPSVIWAERNDRLYVTINVEDCTDPTIKFEEDKLYFSGTGGADKVEYELTLEFFKEINPAESKYVILDRHIPMVIKKKDDGPYWCFLLKGKKKAHWLKTDFNKWRDEDDSDYDEKDDMQFENMMQKMGNFSTEDMAAPPMEEEDSDDEDLPDLE